MISYITFVRDYVAGGIKSIFCRHARSGRQTCSHSTCWSSRLTPNKLLCLLVNQQSSQTANSLVISQKLLNQPSQQENAIIHLINMYEAIYSAAVFFCLEYLSSLFLAAVILICAIYLKFFCFDTAYTAKIQGESTGLFKMVVGVLTTCHTQYA